METIQHRHLVLGATGSIGYAFTKKLLAEQLPVTILVRNTAKATQLFGHAPGLQIIEGDVQDPAALKAASDGKTHIFHGVNYPYHQWENNMEKATQNIIEAATPGRATIILPGNVYNYGRVAEITEDSPQQPCARKGSIRIALEQMLEQASKQSLCKVLIVRLPDFWGPNVLNEGIAPIFKNALKKKSMYWLVRTDIPHQMVYTPDAATVMYQLLQKEEPAPFRVYNFGGEVYPSIRYWMGAIAREARTPLRIKTYSRTLLTVMSLFMPVLKELKEMLYLFESSVILNDTKVRKALPGFTPTPLQQAARETLDWFKSYAM